jgi:hypothetical protein
MLNFLNISTEAYEKELLYAMGRNISVKVLIWKTKQLMANVIKYPLIWLWCNDMINNNSKSPVIPPIELPQP